MGIFDKRRAKNIVKELGSHSRECTESYIIDMGLLLKKYDPSFDLDSKDLTFKEGWYTERTTLLCVSAQRRFEKASEFLIGQGADVNFKNEDGKTPLQLSLESYSNNIAKKLIEAGAKVTGSEAYEEAILKAAVQSSAKEIVEKLIKRDPKVNKKDEKGNTLLHYASKKEIAEILVKAGADVNIQNNEGKTPLYLAIERKENEGKASLYFTFDERDNDSAIERKNNDMIKFLLNSKTDISLEDKDGKTAFDKLKEVDAEQIERYMLFSKREEAQSLDKKLASKETKKEVKVQVRKAKNER